MLADEYFAETRHYRAPQPSYREPSAARVHGPAAHVEVARNRAVIGTRDDNLNRFANDQDGPFASSRAAGASNAGEAPLRGAFAVR